MIEPRLPSLLVSARVAALALALAVLAAAALAAGPARAGTGARSPAPLRPWAAAEEEVEEDEVEEAAEEEIEVEVEFEEGEGESALPPECLLRAIEPRPIARLARDDLRLSLRYAAATPVRATVSYWLETGKGTARLGSATRRLGRRGVLEIDRRLDERKLARLRAARAIVVRLDPRGAPRFCRRYLTVRAAVLFR
jgi:hypothetical protein